MNVYFPDNERSGARHAGPNIRAVVWPMCHGRTMLILLLCAVLSVPLVVAGPAATAASPSFADVIDRTQPKIVKIHGAGGYRGLEAYQSGFLISETGHVLTVWSYVLDTDYVTVTLNDGRKFPAEIVGADPRLEIAVLKIEAEGLAHFAISRAVVLEAGDRVLAFSNLYGVATGDEPASVQHGSVSATTSLAARRGVFRTPYRGPVYVLDAMTNNPGAPGGALTGRKGRLAGLIGKELRNSQDNTWLNFAIPVEPLAGAIGDILTGTVRPPAPEEETAPAADPLTLGLLGIRLLPDVLPKTPPFVDRVVPGSPAAVAGVRADDLVMFVDEAMIQSCKSLTGYLSTVDRQAEIKLLILREDELLEFALRATE